MSSGDLELHGHSDIFLLGVNWSATGMTQKTNHKFYGALERLHGPWCNQPLSAQGCEYTLSMLINNVTYDTPLEGQRLNVRPIYTVYMSLTKS